jgi:hypothetical protein
VATNTIRSGWISTDLTDGAKDGTVGGWKILFPGEKFSKAHVIDYYIRISKYLLTHLRNHPVTLERFPRVSEKHDESALTKRTMKEIAGQD